MSTFDRMAFAEKAFLTLLSSSPEIEMNEKNLRVLAQYAFICADAFQEALLDDDDEESEPIEKLEAAEES